MSAEEKAASKHENIDMQAQANVIESFWALLKRECLGNCHDFNA